MHPFEHLRHVARARGVDAASIVREAAMAMSALGDDPANLVIACRRILERQPTVAQLWWLCTRMLTAGDSSGLAWALVHELDVDPTADLLAGALPADASVVTVGAPQIVGDALELRPDVDVLCADSRFDASCFVRRLERSQVPCEPIAGEELVQAAAAADLVVVEAVAASTGRVLASVGSAVAAAAATLVGTDVWLVTGLGCRLPNAYLDLIGALASPDTDGWRSELDEIPVGTLAAVVSPDGVYPADERGLRPDCACAPELISARR